jgi:hypothetical protein
MMMRGGERYLMRPLLNRTEKKERNRGRNAVYFARISIRDFSLLKEGIKDGDPFTTTIEKFFSKLMVWSRICIQSIVQSTLG